VTTRDGVRTFPAIVLLQFSFEILDPNGRQNWFKQSKLRAFNSLLRSSLGAIGDVARDIIDKANNALDNIRSVFGY